MSRQDQARGLGSEGFGCKLAKFWQVRISDLGLGLESSGSFRPIVRRASGSGVGGRGTNLADLNPKP